MAIVNPVDEYSDVLFPKKLLPNCFICGSGRRISMRGKKQNILVPKLTFLIDEDFDNILRENQDIGLCGRCDTKIEVCFNYVKRIRNSVYQVKNAHKYDEEEDDDTYSVNDEHQYCVKVTEEEQVKSEPGIAASAINDCENKITSEKPNNMCTNYSKDCKDSYTCKHCNTIFQTVSVLHDHLLKVCNNGSYFVDISNKTAFPLSADTIKHKPTYHAYTENIDEYNIDINDDTSNDVNHDTSNDINDDTSNDVNHDTSNDITDATSNDVNHDTSNDINRDTSNELNYDNNNEVNDDANINNEVNDDAYMDENSQSDADNAENEYVRPLKPHETNLNQKLAIMNKNFHTYSEDTSGTKRKKGETIACEYCEMKVQPGRLKAHLTTHSTERPFKCEQCQKAYKYKSHLNVHLKSHESVLPFCCEKCGKGFTMMYA